MIFLLLYIATIFAANWAIATFGVVPVGFGLMAPAGVYFAGLAFTLRDLTQERLGSSDQMVIRTRKRLIDAARALRDHGTIPPGVDNPAVYQVRSGGAILPRTANWLEGTRELRRAGVAHPGLSRAVLGGLPAV